MLNYRKYRGNIIQLTTFLMEKYTIFKEKHLNIVISENKFSKPTYIILPILILNVYACIDIILEVIYQSVNSNYP